jgi:integrase
MIKCNAANERIKRRYLLFLKDAKGRGEESIDAVAAAIDRFYEFTRKDFKSYHFEQARAFKAHLTASANARTGRPLSASTITATLAALKAFFLWLSDQPGYASRIKYADVEYFSTPDSVSRIAAGHRFKPCATLDEIRAMLAAIPDEGEINKRDRAVIAFTILTGARDQATVSFRLKHVNIERGFVQHDPREVRVKLAKSFPTWFLPVGEDFLRIFVDWVAFLREEKGFGLDEPLFPKTRVAPGDDLGFRVVGLDREPWSNANAVRKIFRDASSRAGLPYFNPHSFRNSLVQVAYELNLDLEAAKAWSQNLGHESVVTTYSSYGTVAPARQGEIIRRLAQAPVAPDMLASADLLQQLADQMRRGAR